MLNIKHIARQTLAVLGVVGVLAFAAGNASAARQPVTGGPAVTAPAHAQHVRQHRHAHRAAVRHARHGRHHHRHHHAHRAHRAVTR